VCLSAVLMLMSADVDVVIGMQSGLVSRLNGPQLTPPTFVSRLCCPPSFR
jgi:hypothetical protein